MRVALVALGPSYLDYIRIAEGVGNLSLLYDEVWAINGFGRVLQCDRVFHMDDVRIQQIRADGGNGKVGAMLEWMKKHPGPIYTSRTHPDYPGLVEFPLEAVLNTVKRPYMNSTVACAITLFIHEMAERKKQGINEPEELACFGVDFTYPNMRAAEEGRACCEFWLGVAQERGAKIIVPKSSSLLDTCKPGQIYGYDTLSIEMTNDKGNISLKFTERNDADLPTAEQIESVYNHALDDAGQKITVAERDAARNGKQHAGADNAGSAHNGPDKTRRRKNGKLGNGVALAQKSAPAAHVEA